MQALSQNRVPLAELACAMHDYSSTLLLAQLFCRVERGGGRVRLPPHRFSCFLYEYVSVEMLA